MVKENTVYTVQYHLSATLYGADNF